MRNPRGQATEVRDQQTSRRRGTGAFLVEGEVGLPGAPAEIEAGYGILIEIRDPIS
jgi:hypothetical protein